MVRNKWKLVGNTQYATIHVDYNNKITKIRTPKNTYYHKGIYPYHNPDYTSKRRNK